MTEERAKRKLSAILSADVKGYSRLMEDDEEATVRTITSYREVMVSQLRRQNGRVVDAKGDNILAEFSSVVDAVRCSVEIQRELEKRNAELPEHRKMEFRIGVNLGDVIEEKETIYGDGVNITARLEALADVGGICISGTAFDHIGKRLSVGYEYMGEQTVKNIEKPVRVYRVLMEPEYAGKVIGEERLRPRPWRYAVIAAVVAIVLSGGALAVWNFYLRPPPIEPASMDRMAFPLPDRPSIAVLPFVNMSDDPKQEYFSDGITENVITALSYVRNMFVISRNSTFTYKGKAVKIQQVAEELGVQYVLEGSVQKTKDRVRITAQLIDALTGKHLWAERYDRVLSDIFAVQDEITLKIISALQVRLTEGERARVMAEKGTKNLEAYLKILQAAKHMQEFNKEELALARQFTEEALSLDPGYSIAYSVLSNVNVMEVYVGASSSRQESLDRAEELAKKALALDDSLSYAHSTLTLTYVFKSQFDKAVPMAEKAVALGPNSDFAHFMLGTALMHSERFEEAIPYFKKSLRLRPHPFSQCLNNLGTTYRFLGRYDEAISTYKKLLKLYPEHLPGHVNLAATYVLAGREKEAHAEAAEVMRIDPRFSLKRYAKMVPYRKALVDQLVEAWRKAGLSEIPPLPLPDKPSIAVLPFDNLSGDPEQKYFSDGMTDDIITDLSKIKGLLVISRSSTFTYKGKKKKIPEIAQELNVRYVLEGSVRRAGDQLRINAQLIDAKKDHHLWAERFDGKMENVFELQDKITGKIVSALAVTLSTEEQGRVAEKGTDNIEAYEAFLKGREHYYRMTPEDIVKAIEYYKQAIKFDPNFSRAYAAMGYAYWTASFSRRYTKALGKRFPTTRLYARYFLELAMKKPTSMSYSLSAFMELCKKHFDKALKHAKYAVTLSPSSTVALRNLGNVLFYTGRPDEAIFYLEKSLRLEPQSNAPYKIGLAYFVKGQYEKANEYFQAYLDDHPETPFIRGFLAAVNAYLGNDVEAKKAYEAWVTKEFGGGYYPEVQWLYDQIPFQDAKVFDRFIEGLNKAGYKGDPSKYHKVTLEHKLNNEEIRDLLFGRRVTVTGFSYRKEWFSYREQNGDFKLEVDGRIVDKGISWLDVGMICTKYDHLYDALPDCGDVYRNPDGDKLKKDEFFKLTDYGPARFSIEE